jgi:hypothetical protein
LPPPTFGSSARDFGSGSERDHHGGAGRGRPPDHSGDRLVRLPGPRCALSLCSFSVMQGVMFPGAHQAEVLRHVIPAVPVNMMNNFTLFKRAAEETLHDNVVEVAGISTVGHSFSTAGVRPLLRDEHVDVPVGVDPGRSDWYKPTLPVEGAQRFGDFLSRFRVPFPPVPVTVPLSADFRISVRLGTLHGSGFEGGGEPAQAPEFRVACHGAGDAVVPGWGDVEGSSADLTGEFHA